MAVVEKFQPSGKITTRIHPTTVTCHYAVFELGADKRILQIATLGSAKREIPDKVSQTLQFDEARARILWELLGREFNFKRSI